jgi:hypothetical protein
MVSVDNDGVISNTRGLVANGVNEVLGTNYTGHDIRNWRWATEVLTEHGMKDEEARKLEQKYWYDPDYLLKAEPMPGAYKFFQWFEERNLEMPTVVTSREYGLYESTVEWYRQNIPILDKEKIVMQKSNEMRGDYYKAWVVKYHTKSDIHLEDSPIHAKLIMDYTDAFLVFISNSTIFDGYHKDRFLRHSSDNLASMPDIYEVIERVANRAHLLNVAQY